MPKVVSFPRRSKDVTGTEMPLSYHLPPDKPRLLAQPPLETVKLNKFQQPAGDGGMSPQNLQPGF